MQVCCTIIFLFIVLQQSKYEYGIYMVIHVSNIDFYENGSTKGHKYRYYVPDKLGTALLQNGDIDIMPKL